MSSGFGVRVGSNVPQVRRNMKKLHDTILPAAKRAAFRHASLAVVSEASTLIAAEAHVPRWMVRGVGSGTNKASGARIGRSGYIPSMEGIILFLRHSHINPAGTAKRRANVTPLKRGGVRVPSVGTFKKGFFVAGPHGGAIYERTGKGRAEIKPIQIEIDPWAIERLKAVAHFGLLPRFRNRFKHELARRTKNWGKS